MKLKNFSYEGKKVYVGIDVHKKFYVICAVIDGEVVDKVGNIPADPKGLEKFLKKRYKGAEIFSAYEAGFSGFSLHRVLSKSASKNIVVHASSIEVASNDRVKNDKRDAKKIATHLQRGSLEGIRIPSRKEETDRELTRTRSQLVKTRTQTGNRFKAKLYYHGLMSHDDERKMSFKLIEEYLKKVKEKPLKIALKALSDTYKHLSAQILELEREIKNQAFEDRKIEKIYRSVPGVGEISARVLANELRDMSYVKNQKAASCLTGLIPGEHSSGDKKRQGHITRQGKAVIRAILIECAWRAIKDDKDLGKIYERLKNRIGGKKAIVAVARKLMCRIRACLRDGYLYKAQTVPA